MILFRYGLPPKINVALFFLSLHIFREKKTKTKSVTNPSVRLVKIDFKGSLERSHVDVACKWID